MWKALAAFLVGYICSQASAQLDIVQRPTPLTDVVVRGDIPLPKPRAGRPEDTDWALVLRQMNQQGGLGRIVCNLNPTRPWCVLDD